MHNFHPSILRGFLMIFTSKPLTSSIDRNSKLKEQQSSFLFVNFFIFTKRKAKWCRKEEISRWNFCPLIGSPKRDSIYARTESWRQNSAGGGTHATPWFMNTHALPLIYPCATRHARAARGDALWTPVNRANVNPDVHASRGHDAWPLPPAREPASRKSRKSSSPSPIHDHFLSVLSLLSSFLRSLLFHT